MEITSSSPDIAFLKTVGSTDMIALNRSKVEVASGRNSMHFGFMVDPEQFDAALRTIRGEIGEEGFGAGQAGHWALHLYRGSGRLYGGDLRVSVAALCLVLSEPH